jgi:hypothetical protein
MYLYGHVCTLLHLYAYTYVYSQDATLFLRQAKMDLTAEKKKMQNTLEAALSKVFYMHICMFICTYVCM